MMPFVSPQVETVLGYPPERFLQDNRFWFELMHPDDYARLTETGTSASRTSGRARRSTGCATRTGTGSGCRTRRDPCSTTAASSLLPGVPVDVSMRHEAEERLRAAEERFRVLVEQMPATIYTESTRHRGRQRARDRLPQPAASSACSTSRPRRSCRGHRPLAEARSPRGRGRCSRPRTTRQQRGRALLDGLPDDRGRRPTVWVHEEAQLSATTRADRVLAGVS